MKKKYSIAMKHPAEFIMLIKVLFPLETVQSNQIME
jgi:hypothetical protein